MPVQSSNKSNVRRNEAVIRAAEAAQATAMSSVVEHHASSLAEGAELRVRVRRADVAKA